MHCEHIVPTINDMAWGFDFTRYPKSIYDLMTPKNRLDARLATDISSSATPGSR
jgi:hypothetical protein